MTFQAVSVFSRNSNRAILLLWPGHYCTDTPLPVGLPELDFNLNWNFFALITFEDTPSLEKAFPASCNNIKIYQSLLTLEI